MRRFIAVLFGMFALIIGASSTATPPPEPEGWRAQILDEPSADCIEIVAKGADTFSGFGSRASGDIFEIRNRCRVSLEFEISSCRRKSCGDGGCTPLRCSGGPFRLTRQSTVGGGDGGYAADAGPDGEAADVEPDGDVGDGGATQGLLPDVDAGVDTSILDGDSGTRDASDASAADATGRPDVEPTDAGDDTTVDVRDADDSTGGVEDGGTGDTRGGFQVDGYNPDVKKSFGSAVYAVRNLGLSGADFEGHGSHAEVTFDWRLRDGRSGTFRVEILYLPDEDRGGGSICGCAAPGDGLPVAPWALFAVGLLVLRRRRD